MAKRILKFLLVPLLGFFARVVIRRYRPKIVMVTGSVGKTSTKDAVAKVLGSKFYLRKSEKSFNSEFGVPFTILGVDNPWNNPIAWLRVIGNAFALLFLPNHYPAMLVLEVGADRPGDLARILKIALPDAVVVTRLPDIPVHVEAYPSPQAVQEEEFSPAYGLPPQGPLIISADDAYAVENSKRIAARVFSYGMGDGALVQVRNADFYMEEGKVAGMRAEVRVKDEEGTAIVKGSVGKVQLYPAAAALAAAHAFNIPLAEALTSLEGYEPPAGRGRVLEGKNDSIIIDDTYNASPAAVEEALQTLKSFPGAKRRAAVLGDMLELGRYSIREHERIGKLAHECADIVVAVGLRSRAFGADRSDTLTFESSRVAAEELADFVHPGDVILIKGSQSIRMERIVKALLKDQSHTHRLVRQDKSWMRR